MNASAPLPALDVGDIAALAQYLAERDFPIASQQMIAAAKLLSGSRRTSPADELGPYLAPIFCSSAAHQLRFPDDYRQWLSEHVGAPGGLGGGAGGGGGGGGAEDGKETAWTTKARVPVLVGVFVLLCLAGLLDLCRLHDTVVVVRVNGVAVSGTVVQAGDSRVRQQTNMLGQVVLRYRRWHLPFDVRVSGAAIVAVDRRGFVSKPLATIQPSMEIALTSAPVAPVQLSSTILADKLGQLPAPDVVWKEGASPGQIRLINWVSVLVCAAALLLPLACWLFFRARRRGFLERLPRDADDTRQRMQAQTTSALPALAGDVRYLSREMRRRRSVASRALDVAATLRATLGGGGLPRLVFGTQVEPEYLVLVDRVSAADHQTRLSDDVIKALSVQGVCLERYVFNETPRVVRHAPLAGAWLHATPQSLEQLFSRHPDASLLIFSDGNGLIDAYSGKPKPAIASLLACKHCVLITPQPRSLWSTREWQLVRAGLSLAPLDSGGLRAVAEILRQEAVRRALPREAQMRPRQAYLRDVDLLLDRRPLEQEGFDALMHDLRADLDADGMAWLAACAVYPEIHWAVTLAVGDALHGAGAKGGRLMPYAQRLAQLARLPWLRVGYMPDWLRNGLLEKLSEHEDRAVRASLNAFLSEMTQVKGAAAEATVLDFSSRGPWRDAWSGLCAWLSRRQQPAALEDTVFLKFMSGRRPHGTVDAVEALMKLFFKNGLPLAGLRAWPVLAGVAVAATIAYVQPPLESVALSASWEANAPAPVLIALDAKGMAIASADDAGGIVHDPLVSADGNVARVSCKTQFGNVRPLALSLEGKMRYAYALADNVVEQSIDTACNAAQRNVKSMPIEPNGSATRRGGSRTQGQEARDLCVFGTDTIVRVSRSAADALVGPRATAQACAASPDQASLYIASSAGMLSIFSLADKALAPIEVPIPAHGGSVSGIAPSGDGSALALVQADGSVSLYWPATGQWSLLGKLNARAPVALSGDALTLATATPERTVNLWQLKPPEPTDPPRAQGRTPVPVPVPTDLSHAENPLIALPQFPVPSLTGQAASTFKPAFTQSAPRLADPPPSADLFFEITGSQGGIRLPGDSVVHWRNNGATYTISSEAKASVLGTFLEGSSKGSILSSGLAPDEFVEKRIRKDQLILRFDRAIGLIDFGGGVESPLPDGLQDRESFVWQLVSMVRARPEIALGAERVEIPLAGRREVERWRLEFVGTETIVTGAGRLTALHFVRYSDGKNRLDLWLAEAMDGYPVKIRVSGPGEDAVEQTLARPPFIIGRESHKAAPDAAR